MAEKEYIELGEAKRVIKANDWQNHAVPNVVNMILDRLPSPDVVEVVRCKDCEHYQPVTPTCGNCFRTTVIQRPEDFCSRGERKEATP